MHCLQFNLDTLGSDVWEYVGPKIRESILVISSYLVYWYAPTLYGPLFCLPLNGNNPCDLMRHQNYLQVLIIFHFCLILPGLIHVGLEPLKQFFFFFRRSTLTGTQSASANGMKSKW